MDLIYIFSLLLLIVFLLFLKMNKNLGNKRTRDVPDSSSDSTTKVRRTEETPEVLKGVYISFKKKKNRIE